MRVAAARAGCTAHERRRGARRLPEPDRFAADVGSGRLDPETLDFAAAGLWELPRPRQPDGSWRHPPVEQSENLDHRRAAVGMKPIAEHSAELALAGCAKPVAK